MISDIKRLEHKIGEKIYHFTCAPDSPIAEVREALSQFLGYVVSMENSIKATPPAAPAEPNPIPVESTPPEPPKE